MNDFVNYLLDERPFLACFAFATLAIAASSGMVFILALAVHGFWLPFVLVIFAPLVRVVFLYVRFKNDLR